MSPSRPSAVALRTRVSLIHEVDFTMAMQAVAEGEGIDLPDPPRMIFCPFPAHDNTRTPAFYLRRTRWECYGCGQGGDVIEFTKHLLGVSFKAAIEHVERVLGIGGDELAGLAGLLRRVHRPEEIAWRESLAGIEVGVWTRLRPYLLAHDPMVVELVRPEAEYVFGHLAEMELARPLTQRGTREGLRALRVWAHEYTQALETRVERLTGRDRDDLEALRPAPAPVPEWWQRLTRALAKRRASKRDS